MKQIRVAAHQPNLFPWLGFFDKMRLADVFVLLDIVPFNRRGYQHRVRIGTHAGPRWLTLPVRKKGRYGERTDLVEIDDSRPWAHDHLETLRHAYARTPGWHAVGPRLESLYEAGPYARLVEFTIPGIELLKGFLGITTEMRLASDLLEPGLASSELLSAVVLAAGGNVYLSGPTGADYMDAQVFSSRGVKIEYTRFEPFPYEQDQEAFEPGLSAIDLLCRAPDAATPWRAARVDG